MKVNISLNIAIFLTWQKIDESTYINDESTYIIIKRLLSLTKQLLSTFCQIEFLPVNNRKYTFITHFRQ